METTTREPRSRSIALFTGDVGDALSAEAQRGTASALRDTGYATLLFAGDPGSPHLLADIRRILEGHTPSGAILFPPLSALPGLSKLCRDSECRLVGISPGAPLDEDCLSSNDRQAAADMTNYLIALGHRRIGYIAGPDDCPQARERELGYIDALAAHGFDRGADLVAAGDGSFASGRKATRLLLEVSPLPSAIFAATDDMAAGAMHLAHEAGIAIPGKLSVAGFGDTPLAAQLWPQLTSVRLPIAAMAFTAAVKLIDPGAAPKQPVEFFGEIVARASAGPALD